jgi:hypothetical protein
MSTKQRQMKKSYATALFVFGILSVLGLGFLMYRVLDRITVQNPNVLFLLMFLFVGVSAALFLLGIFLGYFYRNPSSSLPDNKRAKTHYRKVLAFERSEKSRLEQNLHEAKKTIVGLKDKIANLDKEKKDNSIPPAPINPEREKELQELRARHDQLQEDLNQRKERIADLQAEIALAQSETADTRAEMHKLKQTLQTQRQPLDIAKEDASLKAILNYLTKLEGIHMALISDDYGLVVETSGSDFPAEKLAAVSSLLSQVGTNVDEIFKLGKVQTVSLGDDRGFMLENFYFELFGLRCALTIARDQQHEYPGLAEETIDAIIESLNDNEDEDAS